MKVIYVAKTRCGVLKIGASRNLKQRLRTIRCDWARRFGLAESVPFYLAFHTEPMPNYQDIERTVHQMMRERFGVIQRSQDAWQRTYATDYYRGATIADAVEIVGQAMREVEE